MIEQMATLDRFDELQKEGRGPQLAVYKNREWEQLFIYSYTPRMTEIPGYLLERVSHYFSYMRGQVDFDPQRIQEVKEKLRTRCIELYRDFATKASEERIQTLEKKITDLSSKQEVFKKDIDALEKRKSELSGEVAKLYSLTPAGIDEMLKKALAVRLQNLQSSLRPSVPYIPLRNLEPYQKPLPPVDLKLTSPPPPRLPIPPPPPPPLTRDQARARR